MTNKVMNKPMYADEIVKIFRSGLSKDELISKISDYHTSDIADALEKLTADERKALYPILGVELVAEIFSYIEDSEEYLKEINTDKVANLISEMDSDDAVDILEKLNDDDRKRIVALLDNDTKQDVRMILSYSDDEIGSEMTTNYISVNKNLSIKEATHELIKQAGENDNINTIYVTDEKSCFCGAVDLKDLIVAREYQKLDDLIIKSYPYVKAHEKIEDCIEQLKDYAEDSIPVLDENKHILGVITAHDIVEVVDEELGEDYAKLGGLTAEEDLNESTFQSTKKRLPWLIILLFLGMGVSSVVGIFETVVAVIPIVICFQSLILDMAGNVGTQSLAVTIRVLVDENLSAADKFKLTVKEMKVGFSNGVLLGIMAVIFVGLYIHFIKGSDLGYSFIVSGCVGFSLLVSMVISSLIGTLVPMFFSKIKIDPAVASGPLITTVNDLVAVVTYYGLVWILLINILQLV
ncbi:magnesium transporter [Ruminococcus sp.]|uniref:magnesium transporter n=1 Tax=Ruminococcus sp. TaxID=41978 RepID=UPI00386AF240